MIGITQSRDKTALVLDDEAIWTRILADLFRQFGYRVIAVQNTEEARRVLAAADTRIDLVVADVQVSAGVEADGLLLLEGISRGPNPPKMIVVTSYATSNARERAAAIGAEFLWKQRISHESLEELLPESLMASEGPSDKSTRFLALDDDVDRSQRGLVIAPA